MAQDTSTVDTLDSFLSLVPYGAIFTVAGKVYEFATLWGKTDPLSQAVDMLQAEINGLVEAVDALNVRLNELELRVAQIENQRHIDKVRNLAQQCRSVADDLSLRPTETYDRQKLAYQARDLVNQFLDDPDIWLWTDVKTTRHFDDSGVLSGQPSVKSFDPDFKVKLALPVYAWSINLFIAAIDLATGGDPPTVSAHYGETLQRHILQTTSRPEWNDAVPAETLAEKIRSRITCRGSAANKYAAKGQCVINIMCDNVMERSSTWVRSVTIALEDDGPMVLCTWSPDLATWDEEAVEQEKGIALLEQLGEMLRQVLTHGSLRVQPAPHFALTPVQPLAILYGIGHDGSVDWYRQRTADGQGAAAGWSGPEQTQAGWDVYTKVFPAGGNHFYALDPNGKLWWFRHDDFNDGGQHWTGPQEVGHSWGSFVSIIPGGDGVLYAIQPDGILLWYRHTQLDEAGDANTWLQAQVDSGWNEYYKVFSIGDGILYFVTHDGTLHWKKHKGFKEGVAQWDGPRDVGIGWQDFRDIFAAANGVIYAQQPDGVLWQYVHKGWQNGGDMSTWREPVPVGFNAGSYRQMITMMTETPGGVR
jgi:hypothetical protein